MCKTISVIIPFYEGRDWLEEALESVFNQTYPIKEIILVNDGSKENIDDIIKKYEDKIKYIYKSNGGPATARNLGIKNATSDYIAFLDSDDLWLPEKTNIQINEMIKNKAVWSHTNYETFNTFDKDYKTKNIVNISNCNGMIYPQVLYSNYIATPSIIIKRQILIDNPEWRFNEKMRYGQDQYMWLCIAERYPLYSINKSLVRVRLRNNNAGLRARVQLRVKSLLYNNFVIKHNTDQISKSAIYAFKKCVKGNKKIIELEEKGYSEKKLEKRSRFYYLLPWLIFKLNTVIGRRKQ